MRTVYKDWCKQQASFNAKEYSEQDARMYSSQTINSRDTSTFRDEHKNLQYKPGIVGSVGVLAQVQIIERENDKQNKIDAGHQSYRSNKVVAYPMH